MQRSSSCLAKYVFQRIGGLNKSLRVVSNQTLSNYVRGRILNALLLGVVPSFTIRIRIYRVAQLEEVHSSELLACRPCSPGT